MTHSRFSCYDYVFLALGSCGYALGFTYRGSLAPITDVLQDELKTTSTGIGLLSSSFYISYALMQIPSGLLLEIYNPSLILGICWFGLGLSIIGFGFAFNLTYLMIIQFMAGIFVGPLFLASASDAQIRFGNKHLALTIAIIVGSAFCSVLIGGVIQAFLFDEYNIWTYFFFGLGSLCIILSFILCIVRICEHNSDKQKINDNIHELYQREMDTFDDTKALLKQSFSMSKSFDYFVYKHCSTKQSKLTKLWSAFKMVIKNYCNWVVGIHAFCITALMLGLNGLWFIPYLMEKFGYSRSLATIVNGLFYISSALGGIIIGKIVAVYPNRKKLIVILNTVANACSLIIIYITNKSTHIIIIIILNCISGFATIFSITFSLLREYNPKECGDTATGFSACVGNFAGLLVPFLIGELMDLSWNNRGANDFDVETNERHYTVEDYNFGFLVLPCCFIIQLIASFVLKQPKY
eukprot:138181_1